MRREERRVHIHPLLEMVSYFEVYMIQQRNPTENYVDTPHLSLTDNSSSILALFTLVGIEMSGCRGHKKNTRVARNRNKNERCIALSRRLGVVEAAASAGAPVCCSTSSQFSL